MTTSLTRTIFIPSGTTWTVPADWNSANNSVEALGAGGQGGTGIAATSSGGGGGSGGYSKATNITLTPGSSIVVQIGVSNGSGASGNDTFLKDNSSTIQCLASSGFNASGSTKGNAAVTSRSVGSIKIAGAAGGSGSAASLRGGGSGAGSSGPTGLGVAGTNSGAVLGGAGGSGSNAGSSSAGSAGTSTTGGAGGNGTSGAGGGAGATTSTAAVAGTIGGGGGGGSATLADNAGANGGNEATWTQTSNGTIAGPGGGGGGGGGASSAGNGGNGGTYGGGGGGGADVVATGGAGGNGGSGLLVITYNPVGSWVVRHQSGIQPSQIPGSITLGWTPTVGNLIFVFMHTNLFTSNVTVNTSSWTVLDTTANSTVRTGMSVYRYVQGGDTATLPALWTAGSTYWAYDVYEIGNVSGTFATDVSGHNGAGSTNASSLSNASLTAAANAICIVGAGQYNGTHNPTLSAGWTSDESQNNSSNYGSTVAGQQFNASGGTSISATVSYGGINSTGEPVDMFMVILGSSLNVYTLSITTGSYVYTGVSTALGIGHKLAITTGSYLYTGVSVALKSTRILPITTGSYLYTGKSINLSSTRRVLITTGTYSLTGLATGLKKGYKVPITTGSYLYTGKSIGLSHGYVLSITHGIYSFTGQSILFHRTYSLLSNTGHYIFSGADSVLTPSFSFHGSFSELRDDSFQDWGTADYSSFLQTYQTMPDPSKWTQAPFVYTFLKETETDDADSCGATVEGAWNWANDPTSVKFSTPLEIYAFRNGFLVSATKHKFRGKGRALQLQFNSEPGKNFNLLGWSVFLSTNAQE